MKIIQVGSFPLNCSSIKGGVEASILGITRTLAKDNEVKVISSPNKSIKEDITVSETGFKVDYLRNPYKYKCLEFLRMNAYISRFKSFQPDVVHIHESTLLCLVLILYLQFRKINTVVTVHGIFYIEAWKNFKRIKTVSNFLKFAYYSLFEYLILLFGKKIIVDTQYVADMLSKEKKKNYHIIPQGVDSVYFGLKDEWNPMIILSTGSISHRKGHEYSIQAIGMLKKDFPDIKCYIMGFIIKEKEQEDYYAYLLRLIKDYELENNVYILPDVPSEQLTDSMQTCNIFILHSYEESQCIAICEAMAAGKPIVSTGVGGIPYVVEDGVNGKLSAFGDIVTFYENIKDILLNSDLRVCMGNASKRKADTYSWDTIKLKVMDVYNL
jgi:glycosyltransferase involved in cell wall biosynthesis